MPPSRSGTACYPARTSRKSKLLKYYLSAKDGQLVEFMKYMQDSMTPDLKPEKGTDEKKN